jgi:ribonuclease HI
MEILKVFTDGSYSEKHSGIGVYIPEYNKKIYVRTKEYLKSLNIQDETETNNRAELCAIHLALKITKDEKRNVVIYSDSSYSIKSLTIWCKNWIKNNWKTSKNKNVKNKDVIIETLKLMRDNITFIHINSHIKNGNYYNECNNIVDLIAKGKKV